MEEPESFHPVWQDAEEDVPAGLHGRIMGQIALNEKLRRRRRWLRGMSVAAAFVIVGSAVLFLPRLLTGSMSMDESLEPSYALRMTMNCLYTGECGNAMEDNEDFLAESKLTDGFSNDSTTDGAILTTAAGTYAETAAAEVQNPGGGYVARAALAGQNLNTEELIRVLSANASQESTKDGAENASAEEPFYGDIVVVVSAFPADWDGALLEDWGNWRVYEAVPGLAEAVGAEMGSTLIVVISEN